MKQSNHSTHRKSGKKGERLFFSLEGIKAGILYTLYLQEDVPLKYLPVLAGLLVLTLITWVIYLWMDSQIRSEDDNDPSDPGKPENPESDKDTIEK